MAKERDKPAQLARPVEAVSSGYVSSSQRPVSTFEQAYREFGGPAHSKLPGEPAFGVWLDGAEESAHVSGPRALAELKTLTAALRNNQKAVAFFHPDHTGPDARHTVMFDGVRDPEILHNAGRSYGFEGATFIPREHGMEAHYLDVGRNMGAQVHELARALGGGVTTAPGHVEFVGADTREDAAKIFLDRLKASRKDGGIGG